MPEKMRNIGMGGKRHEKKVWSNKNEVLGEMKEEINEQICEGGKGDGCGLKQRRRTRLRLLVMGSLCSSQNECDFLDQVYANTIWTPSKVPLLQIWTRTIIRGRS